MYQEIRLPSKRNEVYRIIDGDKTYITKKFSIKDNLYKEIEILNLLKNNGSKVPNILDTYDNILYLEDLGELTFLDWYEKLEQTSSINYHDIILELCNWVKKFYFITNNFYKQQYIIFDVNFRNFIIKNNEIYGIDFEQSQPGKIEVDLGKIIAYALTYDPAMTEWKISFADKLVNVLSNELSIDNRLINLSKEKEIELLFERRYRSYYEL